MTFEEFSDAIDGIYAYDIGCTDSGIHDEALRARVKAVLEGPDAVPWLTRHVRETHLSDKAMASGYSLEDTAGFIRWLSEFMEFDL